MKRCLVVSGGYAPHRPQEAAARLAALLQPAMTVVHADSLSAYDDEDLESYDLIVPNWTLGEMSVATSKRLCAAVAAGVGFGGFHGGMVDGFRDNERFRFLAGGAYAAEPGGVRDYTVTITAPEDPVVAGIGDFPYRSEQYYLHVDPAVEVLAATRFNAEPYPWLDGVMMPVVWKKRFGSGRVFFSALGHVPEEFDCRPMAEILRRGLLWAAR
ncbi:ThuA domain-containing protein [Pseudoxanthobacter sp.]|uniref:ThuA domain-containing protein n=1 Tax=Pseudoxanthobacter sp. TaxID=1925742 RepID=UPI002FE2E24F